MHKIAENISKWMIQNGADENLLEEYTYGIEGGLSTALFIVILLIIGIILKRVPDMLVYIAVWIPMRFLAGGVHANTHLACTTISVAIGVVCTQFALYINALPIYAVAATIILCYIILFAIAPVVHKNHPVTKGHIMKMRKVGRITEALVGIAIIAVYFLKWHIFAAAFAAYANVAVLAVIGYFNKNTLREYE